MTNYVSAVIVAAGNSTRMNIKRSKQLIDILSRPAIFYTLAAFSKSKLVDEIVLVCRNEDMEDFKKIISENKFLKVSAVVTGGNSRQESVLNGIRESSDKSTHFAIHDGARICITTNEIDKVIEDAFVHLCSTLGVPVKDTIKILDKNNKIENTPNREFLWSVQTPQVFEKELYLKAIEIAKKESKNYTDDCQLLENIGHSVHVLRGEYTNIKITTNDDILIAESIIKGRGE